MLLAYIKLGRVRKINGHTDWHTKGSNVLCNFCRAGKNLQKIKGECKRATGFFNRLLLRMLLKQLKLSKETLRLSKQAGVSTLRLAMPPKYLRNVSANFSSTYSPF